MGDLRRRRLERRVAQLVIAQPDDATITVCAELRQRCRQAGHARWRPSLTTAIRWIAATAIRLGLPLVSHDGVFMSAPDLELRSLGQRP